MKLTKVHITNFQSIQDSTEFEIGDVTCLVGKNEAGKTALLKALYRLNPINEVDGDFDVTDDYPRRTMADYEVEIASGDREPAEIVQATYALECDDITAVREFFGCEWPGNEEPTIILKKGYENELTISLNVDADAALKRVVKGAGLSTSLETELLEQTAVEQMLETLASNEQTEVVQQLTSILQNISEHDVSHVVYDQILHDRIPKFLYFDEYHQMTGEDNIEKLMERVRNNDLKDSDYPLLGLIDLASLNLDQIINTTRTESLIARLEAAGNSLTQKVLPLLVSEPTPSYEV